jgi:thymidylate kinase
MDRAAKGPRVAGPGGIPPRLVAWFERLAANEVRWTLLRAPESLRGLDGDVDVLVHPADAVKARDLAAAQGFVALPYGDPAQLHAVAYDRSSRRYIWLDVRHALAVGPYALPVEAILAASSSNSDGLAVLPDSWLLWLVLLTDVIERSGVPPRHRDRLARLANTSPSPPVALTTIARNFGIDTDRLVDDVAAGRWTAVARAAPRTFVPPLPSRLRGKLLRIRRAWTLRGASVAVIGPDGAGKSTLVRGLADTFPLPTAVSYMGLTGGRLATADRLRVPGLVFLTRAAVIWARYLDSLRLRALGRTVVFDRSVLDASVPSGWALSPVARFSRRVQGRICPRPQLVLVLDAPGDVLHVRSGEYDADTLERWRRAYRRVADRLARAALLDATASPDDVLAEANSLLWRLFGERWR